MPEETLETPAASAPPAPSGVADVPRRKQESWWFFLGALAAVLVPVIDSVIPLISNDSRVYWVAAGAALAAAAGRRARTPGADARAKLGEVNAVAESALQFATQAAEIVKGLAEAEQRRRGLEPVTGADPAGVHTEGRATVRRSEVPALADRLAAGGWKLIRPADPQEMAGAAVLVFEAGRFRRTYTVMSDAGADLAADLGTLPPSRTGDELGQTAEGG
jgi:hypothetical protein